MVDLSRDLEPRPITISQWWRKICAGGYTTANIIEREPIIENSGIIARSDLW